MPFSHDEVVHGKATIIQKMNGQYEEKFPQARELYLYMYTHPGKKLNFMGNEIAQFREWNEKKEQDWDIVKYPAHDSFALYMKDLSFAYQNNPALYELDYEKDGFNWIDCHQEEKRVYVYVRRSKKQRILVLLNFSAEKQVYELSRDNMKHLKLILASDNEIYDGNNKYMQEEAIKVIRGKLNIEIGAFSGLMFEILE